MKMNAIDIRNCPDACDAINAIINNKGIAEVKREYNGEGYSLTIIEQSRTMKYREK